MKEPYLEVTYRHGRPLAAYLYLPRTTGEKSVRTSKEELGMVVDFDRNGHAIGVEITAPSRVTVTALNRVLNGLGLPPVAADELAPLQAA
jgi:uncharacterized protein YuzE